MVRYECRSHCKGISLHSDAGSYIAPILRRFIIVRLSMHANSQRMYVLPDLSHFLLAEIE